MQWDAAAQSGFSTNASTWLPLAPDYVTLNVATEKAAPDSLLNFYTKLIMMRRSNAALHDGGVVFLDNSNPNVLSYVRTAPAGSPAVVVSLNMSTEPQTVSLNLAAAGVKGTTVTPLMTDGEGLAAATSVQGLTLPAYGTFVAQVQ